MTNNTFAHWAPIYRSLGYWPRPITPGSKACREKSWTTPDTELSPEIINKWDRKKSRYGIGLLMGSQLPDGSVLGALDIDHDAYAALGAALLRNSPCTRFGKKGAVHFVRVRGVIRKTKMKVKGEKNSHYGEVAEFLVEKKLCVIPPTIHPDTGEEYQWTGKPLHEIDFKELPIIGA
ncbi:MAG: bifunctional DNA primase/polymerase [Rickettsiales bacterium]|nr:bifunctional DNA primase/polymerase [Rickettsiales bacterium]